MMILLSWLPVRASGPSALTPAQQAVVEEVILLVDALAIDSALVVITDVLTNLSAQEKRQTFGLELRFRQAEILEKDDQDTLAVQHLLEIVKDSEWNEAWEIQGNAQLSLARLQEKLGRTEEVNKHLDLAKAVIEDHQLEELYSRYAVRRSSYFRVFSINQDSALHYAREAIRTGHLSRMQTDLATGHLLVGLLLGRDQFEEAVMHLKKAGAMYYEQGDLTGYAAIQMNLSRMYLSRQELEQALLYSDSAALAAQLEMERGNSSSFLRIVPLHLKANIFQRQEQWDSAWHYLSLTYDLHVSTLEEESNDAIVEVEQRYYDEEQKRKIEEQEHLLAVGKARRSRLVATCLVILLFTGALWYSHQRLQIANNKIAEQALALGQANTDLSSALDYQLMLQGEVHHRVKNNLQTIISLLELQQTEIKDPQALESLETMSNRIFSIAALHELLYQKEGTEVVNLLDYTRRLCTHLSHMMDQRNRPPVFRIQMDNQPFSLATLMPLGLIINELVTNSMKYARAANQQLTISIELLKMPEEYCIQYRDNGPGYPTGTLVEKERSLGTYLLRSMARQLNGRLQTRNEDGAVCELYFNLESTSIS